MQNFSFDNDITLYAQLASELEKFFKNATIERITSTASNLNIYYGGEIQDLEFNAVKKKCPSFVDSFFGNDLYNNFIISYEESFAFFAMLKLEDGQIKTCYQELINKNQEKISYQMPFYLELPKAIQNYFGLDCKPQIELTLAGLWIDLEVYDSINTEAFNQAQKKCPSFEIMAFSDRPNSLHIDYYDAETFFELIEINKNSTAILINYFKEQLEHNKSDIVDNNSDVAEPENQHKPTCCNIL